MGKILIFGHGQLANLVREHFRQAIISTADVRSLESVKSVVAKYRPEACLNTAAKTSLEWCAQNKTEALAVNTLGALNVYEACRKNDVFLCHISTGCIFQSPRPDVIFTEDDPPAPVSFYSQSKVWAENLLAGKENVLILRPRLLVSSEIDPRNLISKWLTFTHFITELDCRTVVEDMLPVLFELIERRISGLYHIVNEGPTSSYECAKVLKEMINPAMVIQPTTLAQVNKNLAVPRVSNVLSTEKLVRIGYRLPPFRESFRRTVVKFRENLERLGGLKALSEVREETIRKYRLVTGNPSTFDPQVTTSPR